MLSLTWEQVLGRRLARGRLLEPAADPVEAASAAAGIHAQVFSAAELSLSARAAGLTRAGLADELWERRRLVKTWCQRGTLHVLPAGELPLWLAAVRDGAPSAEPDLVAALAAVLDERPRTRDQLADELGDERLRSSWGTWLGHAARAGVLCFGPSEGAAPAFVRLDRWTGYGAEPPQDAALQQALHRYLSTYGPARPRDFATWIGVPPARAREAFEAAGHAPVSVEGARAFVPVDDAEGWEPARGSVRLLAQYDAYLVGSRFGREHVIPSHARARAREHGRGRWEGTIAVPTVLADGVVAGFWSRERRGGSLHVTVELLRRVPRRLVRQEAQRVAAFLDLDLDLEYGPAF